VSELATKEVAAARSRPRRTTYGGVLRAAVLSSLVAAAASIVIVTAIVLLIWASQAHSSVSTVNAFRAAGQAWLYAHHAVVRTGIGSVALTPLGLFALPVALLGRAGYALAQQTRPRSAVERAQGVAGLVVPYLAVGAAVQLLTTGGPVEISLPSALGAVLVVSLLSATAGVMVGAADTMNGRVGVWLRPMARGAGIAVAVLFAGGALITTLSLVEHSGTVMALTDSLGPNIVGVLLLLVLSALFAPNLAVSAAAFAVGPGFSVGTGTGVTLGGSHLGAVPAFPPLAALPSSVDLPTAAWFAVAVPVMAGAAAGVFTARRRPRLDWLRLSGVAAGAGALSGAAMAVLAALAGGSLGDGRLATIGPSPWQTGLAAGAEVAVVAVAAALAARLARHQLRAVELPPDPATKG
jgi:hypothetical protein